MSRAALHCLRLQNAALTSILRSPSIALKLPGFAAKKASCLTYNHTPDRAAPFTRTPEIGTVTGA